MAKVLENYKKTNFSSKSQPGACLAVCLIFWPISAWRAYKLRAYKKKVCIPTSVEIEDGVHHQRGMFGMIQPLLMNE